MIRRESEARERKRLFLLGRCLVVFLAGALSLLEVHPSYRMGMLLMLGASALFAVYLLLLDPLSFYDIKTQSSILLIDEVTVFTLLLVAGSGRELLVCFFLVIIIAALIEDLALVSALASVGAMATMIYAGLEQQGITVGVVLRVPFVLISSLYFGFAVLPERKTTRPTRRVLVPEEPDAATSDETYPD